MLRYKLFFSCKNVGNYKELKKIRGIETLQNYNDKSGDIVNKLLKDIRKDYSELDVNFQKCNCLNNKTEINFKGVIIKRENGLKNYNDYSQVSEEIIDYYSKNLTFNDMERNVFKNFWCDDGFESINALLRSNQKLSEHIKWPFKNEFEVKKVENIMANLIGNNGVTMEVNTVLWGGVTKIGMLNLSNDVEKNKTGGIYQFESYTSSSFNKQITLKFLDKDNVSAEDKTLFCIYLNKNKGKDLPLNGCLSNNHSEAEFLFNKETKFKLDNITKMDRYTILDIIIL